MKKWITTLLVGGVIAAAVLPAFAQAPREDAIWARTAQADITLDGVLNEADWAQAESWVIEYGVDAGIPGSGYKTEAGWNPPANPTYATVKFLVRGNPKTNDELKDPGYLTGLGLLPGVVIDAHFRDRDRTAELGGLVAEHPQLLGLGVDADTALVIQGARGQVLGQGMVTVFDHRRGAAPEEGLLLKGGATYDLVAGELVD